MDRDNELWRAKWLFLAGAIFLISTIFAYQELVFLVFGHTVPARVTRLRNRSDPLRVKVGTRRTVGTSSPTRRVTARGCREGVAQLAGPPGRKDRGALHGRHRRTGAAGG
jgi:hypothetical protein